MAFDAVFVFQQGGEIAGAEQAERALEHRADLIAGLQDIDWPLLHHFFETFGERGFAAADRSEQIENLPLLFQTLRGMFEITDDPLDRVFHAVEAFEGFVALDSAIEEDSAEPRVLGRIEQLLLTDGGDHPLRR